MTELPRKAGRYFAAKHITLYVPPLGRPWFHIIVSFTRQDRKQVLERKLYVNVQQDFVRQLDEAKAESRTMYSEVRKRAEEYAKAYLNSIVKAKQDEHREVTTAREQTTERLRMQARADVQRVWAFYGPEIDMRKPFFIQQWI